MDKFGENKELEPYKNILEKKIRKLLHLRICMLAYLLHPQYNGTKLPEKQETVRNYAAELLPDFLPLIIAFQAEAKLFFFLKLKI